MFLQPGNPVVEVNININQVNGLLYLRDGQDAFRKKHVHLDLVDVYIPDNGAQTGTKSCWVSPSGFIGIPINTVPGKRNILLVKRWGIPVSQLLDWDVYILIHNIRA